MKKISFVLMICFFLGNTVFASSDSASSAKRKSPSKASSSSENQIVMVFSMARALSTVFFRALEAQGCFEESLHHQIFGLYQGSGGKGKRPEILDPSKVMGSYSELLATLEAAREKGHVLTKDPSFVLGDFFEDPDCLEFLQRPYVKPVFLMRDPMDCFKSYLKIPHHPPAFAMGRIVGADSLFTYYKIVKDLRRGLSSPLVLDARFFSHHPELSLFQVFKNSSLAVEKISNKWKALDPSSIERWHDPKKLPVIMKMHEKALKSARVLPLPEKKLSELMTGGLPSLGNEEEDQILKKGLQVQVKAYYNFRTQAESDGNFLDQSMFSKRIKISEI